MSKLDIVCSYHKEWVLIVRSFGEHNYCEDIVQDMYLKLVDYNLLDRIFQEGKLNKGYIWVTLRTMYLDTKKANCEQPLGTYEIEDEPLNLEYENKFDELLYNLTIELNELDKPEKYPYNKELFKLYALTDMSYQDIENEIGITKRSAHYTVSKCKDKLKDKLEHLYYEINKSIPQ